MAQRPCLTCGTLSPGTRCPPHQQTTTRLTDQRKRERRPERSHTERKRRADIVAAWRAVNGDWCPGWQCDPHTASSLTADHIIPVAAGGREDGPLTVLCLACNGRKGNRG